MMSAFPGSVCLIDRSSLACHSAQTNPAGLRKKCGYEMSMTGACLLAPDDRAALLAFALAFVAIKSFKQKKAAGLWTMLAA